MACVERPRMEGAQSNLDVENYKTMAGMVGIAQSRLKPPRSGPRGQAIAGKYAEINGASKPATQSKQPVKQASTTGAGSFNTLTGAWTMPIDPRMVKWDEAPTNAPTIDPRMVKWEDVPQDKPRGFLASVGDVAAGFLRGARSIGATLLAPVMWHPMRWQERG